MHILILSTNYPPDIGPGALRTKSIVDALVEVGPSNLTIDVITTMPNRYHSFNISAQKYEVNGKVSINRIDLPIHKNGILDHAKAFIYFCFGVKKLIIDKKYNVVVSTSSRLMTASLSVWVAKKTDSKIYLDIRDLFTDTIDSIFFKTYFRFFMPIFHTLEKWTFNSADKINVVSEGFVNYVKKISPNLSPSVYTNGVDDAFLKRDFSNDENKKKPLILYTGNIGSGQGLHEILPVISNELQDVQFKIIGDGSAKNQLIKSYLNKSMTNVELLSPVSRNELMKEYEEADILFLHLNDNQAFHKVLPSKIFEYAATGKPILAGISGYAAEFFKEHINGAQVFKPCNAVEMKKGLQTLLKGPKIIDRDEFCKGFSRKNIMKKFANDVLTLI